MTPSQSDLARAGYVVRPWCRYDYWGGPGDFILEKPDGLQAIATREEPLWECARAHYRRSQIAP